MPYIEKLRREAVDAGAPPLNAGELNYVLTQTILHNERLGNPPTEVASALWLIGAQYIQQFGHRYQNMNDVIGALMGAALEYHRRTNDTRARVMTIACMAIQQFYQATVAPYEGLKIAENGDIDYRTS
jgi:hypothetical protein